MKQSGSIAGRARRFLLDNDRGIALPMVLVIFLVGFALIGAFLAALVGSSQVTTTTRSSIQAQADAEAGIAAAQVALAQASADDIDFCAAFPEIPGQEVTGVCDSETEPTTITVTSIGYSEEGSSATVQAVFSVSAGGGSPMDTASVFIVGGNTGVEEGTTGSLQGLNITTDISPAPAIIISNGDFECGGSNFSIPGDLIVVNGKTTLGSSNCQVHGNIYSSGDVETGYGNLIGGSIFSGGDVFVHSSLGTPELRGEVHAVGNVSVHNAMQLGSVVVGGDLTNRGTINGSATVSGILVPVSDPGTITGSLQTGAGQPNIKLYTQDDIPAWVDYTYQPSYWPEDQWHTEVWTASDCDTYSKGAAPWALFTADNVNTLIDARTCGSDFTTSTWGAANISLRADLAILTLGGTFANSPTVSSGDGQAHSFFIFTPDDGPGIPGPQCPADGGRLVFSAMTVEPPITVNIYTPCGITLRNSNLRGGLFVNSIKMEWGSSYNVAKTIFFPGAEFGSRTSQPPKEDTGGEPNPNPDPGESTGGTGSVPSLTGGLTALPLSQHSIG